MTLEEKRCIQQQIVDGCERCLLSPENPFTLDNPDAIAANGNKIFAVFIPSYNENENMDHLLRRLFLSQLSYGHKLIPVLLAIEEKSFGHLNNPALNESFSHISVSVKDLLRYINQSEPQNKRSKYFIELQARQYLTYRKNLLLSENAKKEINSVFAKDKLTLVDHVSIKSWSTERMKRSKRYWSAQSCFVAIVEKNENLGFKPSFDQLMTLAFMSKYNYDNGTIYPSGVYDELCLVNTNWDMFDEFGPNLYNHVLSFVGLAPVSVSTDEEMSLLVNDYRKIRNHDIV